MRRRGEDTDERDPGVLGGGVSWQPSPPRGRRDPDRYGELSEGLEWLVLENEIDVTQEGGEEEEKEEEVGARGRC